MLAVVKDDAPAPVSARGAGPATVVARDFATRSHERFVARHARSDDAADAGVVRPTFDNEESKEEYNK